MLIELHLPWPPSVNTYWRHARSRTYISAEGRAYRQRVRQIVYDTAAHSFDKARLAVTILAFPPDRRQRDLDNVLKAVLDSLERHEQDAYVGVFANDAQIDDLRIVRMPYISATPGLVVTLEEISHD